MRVLNQMGSRITTAIQAAVPDVEVVEVPWEGELPDVEADVLVTLHRSANLPELARRVPWFHSFSTGVDGIPPEVFDGRVVTCSRGASAVPISEYVLAAMLAFEKRLPQSWSREPPEHWGWATDHGTLEGKTLGVVGLGSIGGGVAARALPFGMDVRAVRRTAAPSPVEGVTVVGDLDSLLPHADHLVVAAPATARTRHLLDEHAFEMVKPGVHLVNIARGTLVDQDALRAALDDGRVALATLDVCDPEPLPAGHWLYEHPKVRLSAHISWASPKMVDTIVELFVANLRRYAAGEPLEGVVDPVEGY